MGSSDSGGNIQSNSSEMMISKYISTGGVKCTPNIFTSPRYGENYHPDLSLRLSCLLRSNLRMQASIRPCKQTPGKRGNKSNTNTNTNNILARLRMTYDMISTQKNAACSKQYYSSSSSSTPKFQRPQEKPPCVYCLLGALRRMQLS